MSLSQPVLVLNKGWTPVGTVPLQRAIIMLFSDYEDGTPKAKIIEPESYAAMTWADWAKIQPRVTDEVIRASNMVFRCPEVIVLTRYDKFPEPKSHFSRRTLYKRDRYTCQYCGCHPGTESLTLDHVVPRSRGGLTTWTNVVLACIECNSRKANRTPQEAGMVLRSVPQKPKIHLFRWEHLERVKSFEAFLGEAYWNVELKD
jgi:5-methylcytosine-specific restriction endonuclease McrA